MGPPGRPGGWRRPGRRPLRPPKPDRPPLRKPSGLLQGHWGPRPGPAAPLHPKIRLGSRLGGRSAPSRQSDRRFAAGPSGSPTAKRRSRSAAASVLRRRILAQAAALCSASREAQGPGGARIGAQKCVEQSEPGPGGANSGLALPRPSGAPAPRLGSAPVVERLGAPGFSLRGALCGEPAETAPKGAPERAQAVRRGGRDWRESPGYDEFCAAVCHAVWRRLRPTCREVAMSEYLTLSGI